MSVNGVPNSPRVGKSPRLKAKWLSHTMAYQYGNSGNKNSEILVLSNDLDQYLQDIFQSIDTKGRGKITCVEFRLLCDVLNLKSVSMMKNFGDVDLSFKEFHQNLCEHFACYGDYTGFLVNQTFRAINTYTNTSTGTGKDTTAFKQPDCTKRSTFQKKMANSTSHRCIHDAEIFKNWDKLRLSGFRLSEMREQIDHLLYEVTYHKEESQTLKEIVEDLRSMLQSSDAQNIAMQVALKRYQRDIINGNRDMPNKINNRHSLPIDPNVDLLVYRPLKGEENSVRVLARELSELRELRDKEVKELINFNTQLQHDVTELSREICHLEAERKKQAGQLEMIVKTYKCCRELFAICVESIKEVETGNNNSGPSTPVLVSPGGRNTQTPGLKRSFSFSSTNRPNGSAMSESQSEENADDHHTSPEDVLIKRLGHEVTAQQDNITSQQQEIFRLNQEVSMCRRHLQSANFQVEALETECSRLLALEDQLVCVFRLLQKGRSQCLSRKTLGQLLLDVIDSSFCEDEQDMTADQFIRALQKTLTDCPLFLASP